MVCFMDKTAFDRDDKYLVPGLVRGLQVLQAFTPERSAMTLSQIAQHLGMTRSAAFRAVYTLSQLGYLLHDTRTGHYSVGPSVLRLGYGHLATREVVEIALPELERLRDRTDWSAHLGIRDGRHVLYMLRVPSRRGLASIVHVGSRLPAAGTTMGRVLLAALSEDDLVSLYRDETYQNAPGQTPHSLVKLVSQWRKDSASAVVIQVGSFETGIASIAAPIRDMTGNVIAAINVTQIASFDNVSGIESRVREEILAAAAAISRMLGAAPDCSGSA